MELLKEHAISLRKDGKSYKEIREIVPVSKSTLSLWLRDIQLTQPQLDRLKEKQRQAAIVLNKSMGRSVGKRKKNKGRKNSYATKLKRAESIRVAHQERRRRLLEDTRSSFPQPKYTKDTLAYVGAALYWAEGNKDGTMRFANSDPNMMQVYLLWLREALSVATSELSCRLSSLYLNNGLTYEEVQSFWSEVTGVPENQFTKPTINLRPTSSKSKREHRLPYGVLSIRVRCPQKYWAKCSILLERMGKDTKFVEMSHGEREILAR